MIPDDVIERVREQADIVSVVGEHVKLKRVGNGFRGPCPFHQGKDPNFAVSPRGGYVCFVCHEKGDVFTFVQKRLGLDFIEAVKYVGAKSGVEVKEVSRNREQGPDPRERFWEVNAAAADFFTTTLWEGSAGAAAREYVAKRNLNKETGDRFSLGFAPSDPAAMRTRLNALGFDDARLLEAGLLVVRNEGDEPRPRFRNRLMFPIYDPQGRTIAFGGRVIGQGEPKYLNSAESPVFVKGETLYGLNWAKNAIRKDGRALLVEGYFDCLRLVAAGVESTVAPLGTALTEAQGALIRKYTNTVFLLYDSDKAGLKATFRAGDVLLRQGFKVHVVTFPAGEDPDTFVDKHGKDKLEAQLSGAIDVFERKLQILSRGGWFNDLRRKRAALDRLMPTIRAAADPITFGLYLTRAAEVAGISEDALRRELRDPSSARSKPRQEKPSQQAPKAPTASSDAGFGAETWLVRALLSNRRLLERAAEKVDETNFSDARLRAIFTTVLGSAAEADMAAEGERLPQHAVDLYQHLASLPPLPNADIVLEDAIKKLSTRAIIEKLDAIERDLPLADAADKNEILERQGKLFGALRAMGGGQRWKAVRSSRRK